MLKIFADHNEANGPRPDALMKVLGTQYEWGGYDSLDVDYMITDGTQNVLIEAKEIEDLWASKASGHVGQQILSIVASGSPGFVVVFGSLSEVLQAVPKVKSTVNPSGLNKTHRRSQMDIVQDLSTIRAFCADAAACGVPIHFLSQNHEQSFRWILSYAKHILRGPNFSSWLPRFPVEPRGYACLCSIPGIGDVAARGLLEAYGGISQISLEARQNPDALAACKVNGKALGPAKARKLMEVLRMSPEELAAMRAVQEGLKTGAFGPNPDDEGPECLRCGGTDCEGCAYRDHWLDEDK